ncbi:MAG: phosphoglucosamine mutase [Armatimonadetes bacterium CG2_30_59_28]|nr:MAG: phosphoglucosamine mutase [Armatimonadetes bacterium CG2_30_59_28]PIU62406.1 MAG: phosphoglucosamine mutase [Armatimonadetes bacterium CG07_land_8_20_14_0_80_59_28]
MSGGVSVTEIDELMISVAGIRGVVGLALTPETTLRFARAYGTFCRKGRESPRDRPKVLVARDTRPSGEMLHHSVLAGLLDTCCEVIDLGIAATPTLQLAIFHHEADGAVAITASHNPQEWNALKFFQPNGMYLNKVKGKQFLDLTEAGEFTRCRWDTLGTWTEDTEATRRHLDRIETLVDVTAIRRRKLKVVLDCCNGAAGVISPLLLRELGCERVLINCDLTGHFPHSPEPVKENLAQLCQAVRESGADVGFAHDPDVDRIAVVTEKGEAVGEEYSLVLSTAYVLSKVQGPVVTNLSTTQTMRDLAVQHGCEMHWTPIGDVNVSEKMKEVGAVIGGEGNGGVILPEIQYARDGVGALALLLEYLATSGKSMSALIDELPRYAIVKRTVQFPRDRIHQAWDELQQTISADEVDDRDGLKFVWETRWVHVRPSGTEPIVRVIAEAAKEAEANRLCDAVEERLRLVAAA